MGSPESITIRNAHLGTKKETGLYSGSVRNFRLENVVFGPTYMGYGDVAPYTLELTGTYTLLVEGRSYTSGSALYGLGSGVWTRDGSRAYRAGRDIQAGRVWTNCYHAYPAHAAFGGYKQSGIGRENHKMMLDHYQQTKNLLVSYTPKAQGFF